MKKMPEFLYGILGIAILIAGFWLLYTYVFLPLIVIIIVFMGSFFVKRSRLNLSKKNFNLLSLFVIVTICSSFIFFRLDKYESIIGEKFVAGKTVSKEVLVEPDEGGNAYYETRFAFFPDDETGKDVIQIINWILIYLSLMPPMIIYSLVDAEEIKRQK